jgi:hypothetical protein
MEEIVCNRADSTLEDVASPLRQLTRPDGVWVRYNGVP